MDWQSRSEAFSGALSVGIGRVEAKPLLPKDRGAFSEALNEMRLVELKER